MKIVINSCYGGFSLSQKAYKKLGLEWDGYGNAYSDFDKRSDPKLIAVIRKLGKQANGRCAELKIIEIPDEIDYKITDYDGLEKVEEQHREWS